MAEFRTIHTTYGLTAMAQAEATGTPINLTHIAVGDGNGNPVAVTEGMTNLVRERFRATVNRVYQDPTTPNRFTAELVIPAAEGGFVLREVGVFDATGSLFAVGNLPDTYKPVASEGAYADTIVRMEFLVTNASVVTLQIDPNVAVASQAWVINNVNACFILPGGTTGQVLRKASNGCGDTEWADPSNVNVTVNTVEETQTLAAAQTVVDWVDVTNNGLAVYVEGVRLRPDQWTPDATLNTRITLATSYPAGTKIVGAQNEPASQMVDPLVQAQNLADVPDKALGRQNLGVYSKAETDQKAPAGAVVYFARNSAPAGWLKANGAAISRAVYADLFAAIGTTFGAGDGFNTFNLPDLRGEFVRGWDDGRGVDTGRAFGSSQADAFRAHTHAGSAASDGAHAHTASSSTTGSHAHTASSASAGSHAHSASSATAGSHAHTASSGVDGSHSHTASSSAAGSHYHTGHTGYAGEHSHTFGIFEPDDNLGNYIASDAGGDESTAYTTSSSGAHNHTFNTSTQPDHSHVITVANAGSHDHAITVASAGDHNHAVTVANAGDHSHSISVTSAGDHSHSITVSEASAHTHAITIGNTGGTETRPRNVALLACIKF